jgi:hypothetical protein
MVHHLTAEQPSDQAVKALAAGGNDLMEIPR